MNDKEQKLYNRIKMIVSTTACEYDMTYSDIENALVRVYEEEHSEMQKDKSKEAIIHIGKEEVKEEVKEESEVERSRARARAYYYAHKNKILNQRKGKNKKTRTTRAKFSTQAIVLMNEHLNETPIEVSDKIKKELGLNITPSAISNWRYNHKKKPVREQVEKQVEIKQEKTKRKPITQPVDSSVENYFQ